MTSCVRCQYVGWFGAASDGVCSVCKGKGTTKIWANQILGIWEDAEEECRNCGGSGDCPKCGGTGMVNDHPPSSAGGFVEEAPIDDSWDMSFVEDAPIDDSWDMSFDEAPQPSVPSSWDTGPYEATPLTSSGAAAVIVTIAIVIGLAFLFTRHDDSGSGSVSVVPAPKGAQGVTLPACGVVLRSTSDYSFPTSQIPRGYRNPQWGILKKGGRVTVTNRVGGGYWVVFRVRGTEGGSNGWVRGQDVRITNERIRHVYCKGSAVYVRSERAE